MLDINIPNILERILESELRFSHYIRAYPKQTLS